MNGIRLSRRRFMQYTAQTAVALAGFSCIEAGAGKDSKPKNIEENGATIHIRVLVLTEKVFVLILHTEEMVGRCTSLT